MRAIVMVVIIMLSGSLAACATTDQGPILIPATKVVDTGCNWTRPIYISKADVLTEDTSDDILAHNNAGKARCGWKPAGK